MPLFYLGVRLTASAPQPIGTRDNGAVVMQISDKVGNGCHTNEPQNHRRVWPNGQNPIDSFQMESTGILSQDRSLGENYSSGHVLNLENSSSDFHGS